MKIKNICVAEVKKSGNSGHIILNKNNIGNAVICLVIDKQDIKLKIENGFLGITLSEMQENALKSLLNH